MCVIYRNDSSSAINAEFYFSEMALPLLKNTSLYAPQNGSNTLTLFLLF